MNEFRALPTKLNNARGRRFVLFALVALPATKENIPRRWKFPKIHTYARVTQQKSGEEGEGSFAMPARDDFLFAAGAEKRMEKPTVELFARNG